MNRSSADTLAAFRWLEAFGKAMEAELDEVYGDTERRISCESALARTAFTAIPLGCENASAPAPETDIAQFKGRALFHYFEPAATLKAGAAQIGERTWISAAPRAMLDVASVSTDYRATEYLIKAAMRTDIPADEMIRLAEQIGQQVGLRRIAAVCSLIEEQHRRIWHREIIDWAKQTDGEMAPICEGSLKLGVWGIEDAERDEDFKMIWNVPRREIYDSAYRLG